MRLITCLLVVVISGCSLIPGKPEWPVAPETLTKPCPELKLVPQTEKLSVVIDTVVDNYALYHECQAKVDGWNEWYQKQKKIYEGIE